MPTVPIVHVRRSVTVHTRGNTRRIYACASCGYRAEVEISSGTRAAAEGSITTPSSTAHERAAAGLADELQALFGILPCPKCGAHSARASLYHQNTVLLATGCLCLGGAMGMYSYLKSLMAGAGAGADDPSSSRRLLCSLALGVALACLGWYRRHARIQRVSRAVRWVPLEDEKEARKNP
ncbi:Hypothetical protein A7982_11120 [Minicystis rosea]|nr:Hypothetical protein A7982_11120 [Minicystis rosea]